mmetsp:Transcript_14838/g.33680  ORF Transcript_14838/g.33680 Transcript_14838/m.33680 type:complete len:201 (-) Transcript_14838:407-1009(-)
MWRKALSFEMGLAALPGQTHPGKRRARLLQCQLLYSASRRWRQGLTPRSPLRVMLGTSAFSQQRPQRRHLRSSVDSLMVFGRSLMYQVPRKQKSHLSTQGRHAQRFVLFCRRRCCLLPTCSRRSFTHTNQRRPHQLHRRWRLSRSQLAKLTFASAAPWIPQMQCGHVLSTHMPVPPLRHRLRFRLMQCTPPHQQQLWALI